MGKYHLLNALDTCAELFEQYGGHAAAAGMKIKADKISELRSRLDQHAAETLSAEERIPELLIDAPVSTGTLTLELVDKLVPLEPFGAGNPKPVFVTKGLFIREEPFVMKDKHLKLRLFDSERRGFEAVWWDGVERSKGRTPKRGDCIELAYTPEINTWQGNRTLQLVVEDLRNDNLPSGRN